VTATARRKRQEIAPAKTETRAGRPARKKAARCPICGKRTARDHRPFCSRRCADIDLGRWLKDAYAVPGEPVSAEAEEKHQD
jgi:endogenous inhibitor of DNA gyrase (YacG/DUF329 family)